VKIVITSGHTIEKIDNIRHIANVSTGRLGAAVADAFASTSEDIEICYICNREAAKPISEKIKVIHVQNVDDLDRAVYDVLKNQKKADVIIHAMAVSDYKLAGISSLKELDFKMPESKISSNIENLVLLLKPTPKIIGKLRCLAPDALIIGFKLLDNADDEELKYRAKELLINNNLDFVFANDLKDVTENQHIGYLLDKNQNMRFVANSKEEIARGIVEIAISDAVKSRKEPLE